MNSTVSDANSTNVTMGLVGDTHGSLYKIIGVTLAIASGKCDHYRHSFRRTDVR